ncbi:MAG TPA: hypothetical protein VFN23_16750, partial [Ktedonobacteraceae bacterium]|nr:hypothetical protein [Ktedonobacteraceae bacterium]
NNSALYLGIAGGAAIGGLALLFLPLTQLAWAGAASILIALLSVAITPLLSKHNSKQANER